MQFFGPTELTQCKQAKDTSRMEVPLVKVVAGKVIALVVHGPEYPKLIEGSRISVYIHIMIINYVNVSSSNCYKCC